MIQFSNYCDCPLGSMSTDSLGGLVTGKGRHRG
jgi:hypothetical protein